MSLLGFGVDRWPDASGGFDAWLPVFVLLSFVLLRGVARLRFTWRTSVAALVGGTLWSWAKDAIGVIETSALAVLVAFAAGVAIRRLDPLRRRRTT